MYLSSRIILFHFCLLAFSSRSLAWDHHHKITRESLKELKHSLPNSVQYETLEVALKKKLRHFPEVTDFPSFLSQLQIHKRYAFSNKLDEGPGKNISPLEILAIYSDEPDWGCDQNLFEEDQYPALWNQDSPYVGKRSGLASQGFRHLYFSGMFRWTKPVTSFQIPQRPIGEAPTRAALYSNVASDFMENGSVYWALRFLGWSLHYLQDLLQPYHSRQVPYWKFLRFEWKKWPPGIALPRSIDQISYYHLSYERWTDLQLDNKQSPLWTALNSDHATLPRSPILEDFVKLNSAEFSSHHASTVGHACYQAFSPLPVPLDPPIDVYVNSEPWLRSQDFSKPVFMPLTHETEILFSQLGKIVRSWISHFFAARKT